MAKVSLRQSHPQKYVLKFICNYFYYSGAGWFWYEEKQISPSLKRIYKTWCVISNAYIFGVFINQYLVITIPNLTVKEETDYRQFAFGNTCIGIKIILLYLFKGRIKVLFERFLERNREISSLDLETASLRKAFKYIIPMLTFDYLTLIFTLVEGVTGYIQHGISICIQKTLYPTPGTPRFMFNTVRFFVDFQWLYSVNMLVGTDSLCIFSMVFVSFKFKRLQSYFRNLRTAFLENLKVKNRNDSEKEFEIGLIEGIKLQEDAMWCARQLQQAMGGICSFQIVQSVTIIVMCLVNIITTDHELAVMMPKFFYLIGIIMITGCYMLSAGDITNEAALVTTAIFHCGWELNRPRRRLRTLVVMALMSSQEPVQVKAFGVITLSYSNFVMILRHSYSFFAVMYN